MSDDDHDEEIDIDSDIDEENEGEEGQFSYQVAEKRAHHNALERKRRDHIKESFSSLRDSVPSLQGEKASRAQILKQATDYIQYMSKKTLIIQNDIDNVIQENRDLEKQVLSLEKARVTSNFIADHSPYNTTTTAAADSMMDDVDIESIDPIVFSATSNQNSAAAISPSSSTYSTNPKSLLAKPRPGYASNNAAQRVKRAKFS